MGFKAMLFLFTNLLVVTTRISCYDDELSEAPTHPPHLHHPSRGPHHAHPPATYSHPPKAHAHPPHHEHHHEIAPSQASHHAHPPKAHPPHHVPPVAAPTFAPLPPLKSAHNCTPVCFERCNPGKGKKECERACTRCCKQCLCVPPGPRGTNLEKCGKCYSEVTHHGQIYKCP
ncbi:gibberellin-regulated protein 14-like [Quercus robur]|uniref:gibberellin-regulated protein 14-like n=1 Tax=Quercus robur TaxID=38942 RepID=UPI0021612A90|nr:gibberellin-regulated protein 14-like [Quercus robur]